MLQTDEIAPDFSLPASSGNEVALKDFRGSWLVLYFYPKDMTSGCTAQACALRDAHAQLRRLGAQVVGISRDKIARHHKFIAKEDLPFVLLSDENAAVASRYDAFAEKTLYGKKYWGIVRSTFLLDPDGRVRAIWRNVKVPRHVEAVVHALTQQLGLPPIQAESTKVKKIKYDV